jgi:hypothetical protein
MNQDIHSEFLRSPSFFPKILRPSQMWRSLSFWVNVAYLLIILRAVPKIIVDYWFLKHLGRQNVFWTNFTVNLILIASCSDMTLVFTPSPCRQSGFP